MTGVKEGAMVTSDSFIVQFLEGRRTVAWWCRQQAADPRQAERLVNLVRWAFLDAVRDASAAEFDLIDRGKALGAIDWDAVADAFRPGAATTPTLTVDVVLFGETDEPEGDRPLDLLLIRRAHEPFRGEWALPGGHVNPGELLEDAARRELREETGVSVDRLTQIGVFDAKGRDPRGWTISVAYYGFTLQAVHDPIAADDAAAVAWGAAGARIGNLAFDHRYIVRAALVLLLAQLEGRASDAQRHLLYWLREECRR